MKGKSAARGNGENGIMRERIVMRNWEGMVKGNEEASCEGEIGREW